MNRLNCAIYTRKSSDEGLEKEFNSLDAQREACAAFVKSQKHAGWVALPDLYDDGGLSGGTMDRPALQRLLADIKARKVQIVVVYKVDRLTRSLADFAKIVDVFDAHGESDRPKNGDRDKVALKTKTSAQRRVRLHFIKAACRQGTETTTKYRSPDLYKRKLSQ